MRSRNSTLGIIFLSLIFLCGMSPQEAERSYREMGCHLVGENENGGNAFECCGICPDVEVLRLYTPAWDELVEPTCLSNMCGEDCVYTAWEFVSCGGECGTAGTCAAGEHCAKRTILSGDCGESPELWDCAIDEGCQ